MGQSTGVNLIKILFLVKYRLRRATREQSRMTARESMMSELVHSADWLNRKADEFAANSIVRLSALFTGSFYHDMEQEADMLVKRCGVRRDLRMHSSGCTPRRMTNVAQPVIAGHCPLVMYIYRNTLLRSAISSIVRAPVFDCPYRPERFVITRLHQLGDTHGWHWDDYSLAVVWVLRRAPPPEAGGILQCVSGTRWDKKRSEAPGTVRGPPDLFVPLRPRRGVL